MYTIHLSKENNEEFETGLPLKTYHTFLFDHDALFLLINSGTTIIDYTFSYVPVSLFTISLQMAIVITNQIVWFKVTVSDRTICKTQELPLYISQFLSMYVPR